MSKKNVLERPLTDTWQYKSLGGLITFTDLWAPAVIGATVVTFVGALLHEVSPLFGFITALVAAVSCAVLGVLLKVWSSMLTRLINQWDAAHRETLFAIGDRVRCTHASAKDEEGVVTGEPFVSGNFLMVPVKFDDPLHKDMTSVSSNGLIKL